MPQQDREHLEARLRWSEFLKSCSTQSITMVKRLLPRHVMSRQRPASCVIIFTISGASGNYFAKNFPKPPNAETGDEA